MSDDSRPHGSGVLPQDLGKSIFPTFSVNVPLPAQTAVPVAPSTPAGKAPAPAQPAKR